MYRVLSRQEFIVSTDYFTDSDVIIGVNVFRRGEKHFNSTCFFAIGAKNVIFRQKRVIVHLCTSCELIEINIYIYTRANTNWTNCPTIYLVSGMLTKRILSRFWRDVLMEEHVRRRRERWLSSRRIRLYEIPLKSVEIARNERRARVRCGIL